MPNKKIFISYGRDLQNPQHVELVKKIKVSLENYGFIVLIDIEQLHVSSDWQVKIENMILEADWILYFITPYSARRPDGYCHNELTYSLYANKPIAPLMVKTELLPLSICRIQYIDFEDIDITAYDDKVNELISVLNGDKKLGFEGIHSTLLNKLNPRNSKTIFAKYVHGFIGRKWVYKEVDRWIHEEKDSRVLFITAEAGYGKSALSTYLSGSHPCATSIHFCQHDVRESRDPIEMLKVLIYELSTQIEEYKHKILNIDIKELFLSSAENIFIQLLVEPLSTITKPKKDLFFIIDALDEAKESDGSNLIATLASNRFSDLPSWLNIIITSRPEPELISMFKNEKNFYPNELEVNEENNIKDLKDFILSKIKNIHDTNVNKLIEKSEGNILYLKNILKLDSIKEGDFTDKDIHNLPIGMEAFYFHYFKRKFGNIEAYEEKYLNFVNILVATNESMSPQLIQYILKLTNRSYKKIKNDFGSLLDDNEETISFYHKSLYDWLSSYDISADYSADIEDGHQLMASTLWELYQDDGEAEFLYEPYLLQALYAQKSYTKLNSILQDILFIGRMYDSGKQIEYKNILELTIKNFSHKCDIKSLNIYASFLREKEHIILRFNEKNLLSSQTLFQLIYEDGKDSILNQTANKCIEKGDINFTWLRKLNLKDSFTRSGLRQVLQGHSSRIRGIEILNDNKILSYSDDNTIRLWGTNLQALSVFKEHKDAVLGIKTFNDYFISYSKDASIKIWNYDGSSITLTGHRGWVSGIEVIDKRILSFSHDATIKFWTLEGQLIKTLEGHTSWVNGVKLLNNNTILSYSVDTTLRLWDAAGEPLKVMTGHMGVVRGVEIINNDTILSYSTDGTMRLWDINGNLITVLEGHSSGINGVTLYEDMIISFSNDKTIIIWDIKGSKLKTLEGHLYAVKGLKILNKTIISYSNDNTLRLWDFKGTCLRVLQGHIACINGLSILDNNKILSYSSDDTLRLWDGDGTLLSIMEGHRSSVRGFALFDDKILSYSNDRSLRLWEPLENTSIDLNEHTRSIKGIQIFDKDRILSFSNDFTLRLWSTEGKSLKVFEGHTKAVRGAKILENKTIISYSNDKTLRLWSENAELLHTYEGHLASIQNVYILDEDVFLSYDNDNVLKTWDIDGNNIHTFKGHNSSINGVYIMKNTDFISYSDDGTLILWSKDAKHSIVLKGHTASVKGAEVLRGNTILSYSDDANLILWSKEGELKRVLKGHNAPIKGIVILENKNILSYCDDGTIILWSQNGDIVSILEGHTDSIKEVKALENGLLLSYSRDGIIILWSQDGKLIEKLVGHSGPIKSVKILMGNKILSYSEDNTLIIWSNKGEHLHTLKWHTQSIKGIKVINNLIFSYSKDGTIVKWNQDGDRIGTWHVPVENFNIHILNENHFIGNYAKNLLIYNFNLPKFKVESIV